MVFFAFIILKSERFFSFGFVFRFQDNDVFRHSCNFACGCADLFALIPWNFLL